MSNFTEVQFTNLAYPQKGDRRRNREIIYTCERVTLNEDGIQVRGPYEYEGQTRECKIDLFQWNRLEEPPPEPTWAPKVGEHYQGNVTEQIVTVECVDHDRKDVRVRPLAWPAKHGETMYYSPAEKSIPGFTRVTITPAPEDDDA